MLDGELTNVGCTDYFKDAPAVSVANCYTGLLDAGYALSSSHELTRRAETPRAQGQWQVALHGLHALASVSVSGALLAILVQVVHTLSNRMT